MQDGTITQILIADADSRIAALMRGALREITTAIDCVSDGKAAVKCLAVSQYSLFVFDVLLPDSDGIALIRTIRGDSNHVPVLVLSTCCSAHDKVEAIDAGADDYIVKPFDLAEFVSRCRALIRRYRQTGETL
jgi:DNA-binding response OmpR family regulator